MARVASILLLLAACETWGERDLVGAARRATGGEPARGEIAIAEWGCGACHDIPGIAGADATVGPPLGGWSMRQTIAGKLPNSPRALVAWIRDPQAIEPGNVMPTVGLSDAEAKDIAAYLYTLE